MRFTICWKGSYLFDLEVVVDYYAEVTTLRDNKTNIEYQILSDTLNLILKTTRKLQVPSFDFILVKIFYVFVEVLGVEF